MCVRNGRSGLAAQRLSDFRVGVADWVDEHTLLRRVRRADEAERKDELGTDQVAVPERRLRELTHPVARQQLFLVKSVFRVSSLIFFGFRHEECRPVVCFTGCPSCRT